MAKAFVRCTFVFIAALVAAFGVSEVRAATADLYCYNGTTWQTCPASIATKNASVVIASGNAFQTVLAAPTGGAQRHSLTIQNNNTTDSCWVFIGSGSATKGTSILLTTGQAYARYFPNVPADAIKATCANTSDTLYVDTQ